jgi:2-keto-4-pentenoate hydratase/2-oxohepta-3-ene-1,7-dioic acid hydratase in catechol pathway/alpha-beta hydrolase superfamily lysophospholipase
MREHVPDYPVVFSKPAASIVASGDRVDPHTDITSSLDYEGEIGVIIGRRASKVGRAEAMDYVWGYTLINDVTARDLQRDHKQWFIGKGLDTFCPTGPWAVSKDEIDITDLQLTTHVNGELRQDTNTSQLIFDVPALIETLSAGITLQPGDLIATGTPVGVGVGFDPPKYLTTGDEVVIAAPGLGTLRNTIGVAAPRTGMRRIGGVELFVEKTGEGSPVVLVHGLGGTTDVYQPQVNALVDAGHTVIRYDLSGHGRSPLAGTPSIESWTEDLIALLDAEDIAQTALVAHSMGTLIAVNAAITHPERVSKLALLGPVRKLPDAARQATLTRAARVRTGGMAPVADGIVTVATSTQTQTQRPVVAALVRELLLGQSEEGYALACEALAAAADPDFASVKAPVLQVTGDVDKTSPVALNDDIFSLLPSSRLHVLDGVGHWHTLEAPEQVTGPLLDFLAN